MKPDLPAVQLPIKWDTKHFNLSAAQQRKLGEGLKSVSRLVRNFPVVELLVSIEHFPRSTTWRVKTSLVLSGETLVSLDDGNDLHPAFETCVSNLVNDVHAYKDRMSRVSEVAKKSKGTHQDLEPVPDPDPAAIDRAVADGDYGAFRTALFGYEEPLRKRIGRRVERYPEVSARIDKGLKINDLVEEVFLDAFEQYADRRPAIRLGDWLAGLIDSSIKEVAAHRDKALENINLARSAWAARQRTGSA
jgi:ribosome-associated translation inhibitor RaiA